jgi:hypothetical protein
MNAEEAQALSAALKRWNIPGVVAPEDPGNPEGPWRVYDRADAETRRDITAATLAALAKCERPGVTATGRTGTGPTRGFVIPSSD